MCGICGWFDYKQRASSNPALIDAMTDVMGHRGPDGRGTLISGECALGHRRLSIIDLSDAGSQPMFNEDKSIAVVFNGEIYNYIELRRRLMSRGHRFRSKTDTEVILHAYEEYGAGCVNELGGMFAIAIWDSRRKKLVLARDRLGVKPLYYYDDGSRVAFASEIKSILEDDMVPREVDPQALSNFLTLHYVPGPRTLFKGIVKLEPGRVYVAAKDREPVISRFWELKKNDLSHVDDEELTDIVRERLVDSVKRRMQSDVPIGALLSGGLDSSAITAIMTRLSNKPVPAFTVGYSETGNDGYSEFRHSRLVAKELKCDYHEAIVDAEAFAEFLPEATWHQDEPIGEPASIPLYFVSRLAKQNGISVLLTGEGSDELFCGYNRHWGEKLSRYYGAIPEAVKKGVVNPLVSRIPGAPLLKKGLRSMAIRDFAKRYMSWHTVVGNDVKQELLKAHEGLKDVFDDVFARHMSDASGLSELDKLLYLDINVWLPDDLLMKKDKMGMAASIEARVPFLDYSFVEMGFGIPERMKIRGLKTKHILKKSMEGLLPKEIINRKKQGFPTPISSWLRVELRDMAEDLLLSPNALCHGLFDKGAIRALMEDHLRGREDNNRMLFPLINFEIWHRVFIDKKGASRRAQPYAPARRLSA